MQMQEALSANAFTFARALKACGSTGALDKGAEIHEKIVRNNLLKHDLVLGNALMDMYAKCGALAKARHLLDDLPARDVVSWNTLIAGYVQHRHDKEALSCYDMMQSEGPSPNAVTFTCILKSCSSIGDIEFGTNIHDLVAKQGLLQNNILLGSALVDMYARSGDLVKARQVLDGLPVRNVICWTALISGYSRQGAGRETLACFKQMQREGLSPNAVTFMCLLKACGSIGLAEEGEKLHHAISKQGLLTSNLVLATALVDMYAKCNALAKARHVLEGLPVRDAICWNALINGYVQQCENGQALDCFEQMRQEGLFPNAVTFISILSSCGNTGAADKGEEIHHKISKQGLLGNDLALGNALVDMYARCGALAKAQHVLEELPERNVISWTSLITGFAQQCEGVRALECFQQLQHEGLSPDATTFSSVLNACSRVSLVEEAGSLLSSISTRYGLKPYLQHYTCLLDLVARTGHLDKAVKLIEKVPWFDMAMWSVLLAACGKWGGVNTAGWAFQHAVQVDKH